MNHIPLIIKREYLAKVRKKSFIIMTILSPFILAAIPLLIGYLTSLDEDTIKSIYVLDESEFLSDSFQSNDQTIYTKLTDIDLDTAKAISNQEQADGLLYVPKSSLESIAEHIKFYSKEYDRKHNNEEMASMIWEALEVYKNSTDQAQKSQTVDNV